MAAPPAPEPFAVTGIGMMTPVGHGAYQSCASIRADITRIAPLDYFCVENEVFEEVPVQGCPISGVTDGYFGLGRWSRLAGDAIGDLVRNTGLPAADLDRTGLFIALPPQDRPGVDQRITDLLGLRIGQWNNITGLEQRTTVYPQGHAAVVKALAAAMAAIQAKTIAGAIVGGVDCLLEAQTLSFFNEKERLKTEARPGGFIPGEGAAFFHLEALNAAVARGAEIFAEISPPAVSMEPVTIHEDDPSEATGLTQSVRAALQTMGERAQTIGLVICDLNGETYRAKEFAYMANRTLGAVHTPWRLWHPADVIGDTGAASFAIAVCMAARAHQRGYADTPAILICGASDDGLRAAVCTHESKGV